MLLRQASLADIPGMQVVRNSVKENMLSDPKLIIEKDYRDYLIVRGKGWVCEVNNNIVGFAIVDLFDHNVWALFVAPEFERMGIGQGLQMEMLQWYFENTDHSLWLSTAPGTRAEIFYKKTGWREIGVHGKREIKFELTKEQWVNLQNKGCV